MKTGRWSDAAPQFEAAVAQVNSSAMMHFYLALVYQQTSRNEEALAEFRARATLGSEEFSRQSLVGAYVLKQQKVAEAIPLCRRRQRFARMPLTCTGCWRMLIAS